MAIIVPFRARPAEHLDAAALAKIVRADLRRAFPAVAFSVRTDRYAGGSSVRVSWTDGPLGRDVDAAIARYKVVGFDGMTDSTTNAGPVHLDDGRLVTIYAYLTTSRSTSAALRARVEAWMTRHPERATDPQMGALSVHQIAFGAYLIGGHLAVVPWHRRHR